METPLLISLTGLVLFSLGMVLALAAKVSLAFAIGVTLGFMIVIPFILYGLSCLQHGGCTMFAWFLAIITVMTGTLVLIKAMLPPISEDSLPPTPQPKKNRQQN